MTNSGRAIPTPVPAVHSSPLSIRCGLCLARPLVLAALTEIQTYLNVHSNISGWGGQQPFALDTTNVAAPFPTATRVDDGSSGQVFQESYSALPPDLQYGIADDYSQSASIQGVPTGQFQYGAPWFYDDGAT
jgi:hypothetical protein